MSLEEDRALPGLVPQVAPRAPRRPRRPLLLLLTVLLLVLSACSESDKPLPPPTPTPTPTFTAGKPGGTLRVVGTARSVPLDPALARDDAALLVNRLVFRQLYSYRPGSQEPAPDLALRPPSLSSDRLTATIALRDARWNTGEGRGITAGDVLRALKRLCAPTVLAPERGYLSQMVVGYADFCTKASRVKLGGGRQPDLDMVDVPGLRAVGDNEVQIVLRRPAADLTRVLALPALSPLPFEVQEGFPIPTQLISNGPYRFLEPEAGEVYRLSRNPAWDPAGDPIRSALVDRITFRGGLTAADVQQRLTTNNADLSWDVETPADVLTRTPPPTTFGTARVDDRGLAVVAVGARGPAARLLGAAGARSALAACLDRPDLQKAFGGPTRSSITDDLLTPEYLDVPEPSATPTPSPTLPSPGSSTTPGTAAGSPSQSGTPSARSTARGRATPAPSAQPGTNGTKPLTIAQCRSALTAGGLRPGTDLTLLAADTDAERAGATALQRRLTDAGLAVQLRLVPPARYSALASLGDWDLALIVDHPDFPGSRAVLSPLLDARWPGERAAGAARRSPAWYIEMTAGLAEDGAAAVAERELALSATLGQDGSFVGVLRLATVRTTGPNVGENPPLALLGNADPANVALGVTRPGESASPTPASS